MPSGEQHKLVQLFPTGTPSRQRLRVCCSSETWGEIALSKLTYMDYLSCPTKYIKQHQEVAIVVFLLEVFDVDTSQLWLSGATVRPRQRGRRGIESMPLGDPLGDTIYSKCSRPPLLFFVFSMDFSGFSQNHQTLPILTKTKKFGTRKASLFIRKSLSMFIFGFITFYQSTSNRAIKSYKTAI